MFLQVGYSTVNQIGKILWADLGKNICALGQRSGKSTSDITPRVSVNWYIEPKAAWHTET
jgi:hypothetical protein